MKSVMEHLEFLEKQNTTKDKLINNLNCHVIQLSETLGYKLKEGMLYSEEGTEEDK